MVAGVIVLAAAATVGTVAPARAAGPPAVDQGTAPALAIDPNGTLWGCWIQGGTVYFSPNIVQGLTNSSKDFPISASSPGCSMAWLPTDAEMWLGFTDTLTHQIYVATVNADGTYSYSPVAHAYSDFSPAIASFRGDIYLAYTGTDGHLNIEDNTTGVKTVLADTSGVAPALNGAENGLLSMTWAGTTNFKLNIASVSISTSNGAASEACKQTLTQTTSSPPGVTHLGTAIYLTWTGRDPGGHVNGLLDGRTFDACGFRDSSGVLDPNSYESVTGTGITGYGNDVEMAWGQSASPHNLQLAPVAEPIARADLLSRIAGAPSLLETGLRDDKGNTMDTLQVVPYGSFYLGVYAPRINGIYIVKLATSSDLGHWTWKADLDTNASQPYLAVAPNGQFVLADEKNDPPGGVGSHLNFLHYPDISALYAHNPDLTWPTDSNFTRLISGTCHEGTPDIHGINNDGTSFSFGFHYNFILECTTDREAFGTLTGWTASGAKTSATVDTVRDDAVTAAGYGGKHGGRDDITWLGYRFSLQEASTNVADDSTFRFVLYDYNNDKAYPAPITSSIKSLCHGNPRIVQTTLANGPVLIVTLWIFPSLPCAVNNEGGEALYTVPAS